MADILFGYRKQCARLADSVLEFSRKGRFFATSDFADTGNDWGLLTRARSITKPGVYPRYNSPWTGSWERTLFDVQFDKPVKPNCPG